MKPDYIDMLIWNKLKALLGKLPTLNLDFWGLGDGINLAGVYLSWLIYMYIGGEIIVALYKTWYAKKRVKTFGMNRGDF